MKRFIAYMTLALVTLVALYAEDNVLVLRTIVSIVLCKVFQLFCTSSIFFYAATPGFLDVA